jgi:hypothetical protein
MPLSTGGPEFPHPGVQMMAEEYSLMMLQDPYVHSLHRSVMWLVVETVARGDMGTEVGSSESRHPAVGLLLRGV